MLSSSSHFLKLLVIYILFFITALLRYTSHTIIHLFEVYSPIFFIFYI